MVEQFLWNLKLHYWPASGQEYQDFQMNCLKRDNIKIYVVGGGLKVTLVFCFCPKPKFCSFDLDLDQAEQLEDLTPMGAREFNQST